jgi:dynein heavy chain
LKIAEGKWYKATVGGDEKPLARTQHIALYTSDRVFVFGGHQGPNSRLNDTWFLDVKGPEFEWNKAGDEKVSTSNQESKGGAPHPRANSGACLYQNKVYLFGGHGGLNYARIAYNDLYAFDLETETWSKVVPKNASPDGRGGHSVFASDNRIYVYGGWNSEQQYNNVVMFDLEKEEWSDPDIYNEIPRWNHSSLLVEAIPTWKFFIFGGECAEYNEGVARAFGEYANSSCYLDIGTMKWATFASDSEKHPSLPSPREYSAMAYDTQDSKEAKLVVFGGWNNGWFNDLFTLNVSKIVGPSYAIISSDPCLGQLSGKTPLRITGQGFRDQTIKVIFTQGNKPVDSLTKLSREATGTFVTETEIMVETPSFLDMGAKEHECVMQVSIGSGDFSTTWVTFTYFLNTRGDKSLAYGPGLLPEVCPGYPVEFVIQARNENCENRASGRDNFELKIRKIKKEVEVVEEVPEEGAEVDGEAEAAPKKVKIDPSASLLECKVVDNENGTYSCSYVCDEECEVSVEVLFMNDKGDMEQVRGSPYRAVFMNGVKPGDNKMNGGVMDRHIKKELERIQNDMTEQKKNCSKNDKDMKDVKTLLGVKEATESVIKGKGKVQLEIDQLDESLKLFMTNKQAKESQVKAYHKIQKEWVDLSKQAKETRKDIEKDVQAESDRNKVNIKRLEEEITQFTQEMKKREFFQYKCGTEMALTKLDGVFGELKVFENNIQDYGGNCAKFGNPNQIEKAVKDIELIKQTVDNMKVLWDHIAICMGRFDYFFKQKWIGIQPYEMEDEVKKLQKTLKDCKADKRCAAYTGILDEIKKWLVFLPLIAELADKDMRDRHWDALKKKINAQFTIDDNLVLKDIYDLNLGKYQEDVEEFTDQARQEAKMEKTLAKLDENWKDIVFEFSPHKDSGVQMIRLSEENFDMLEENQVSVTSMFSSRYLSTFEQKITYWQHSLAQISEIVVVISEV